MNFLLVCLELTINIGFYSLVPDTDTGIDPDPVPDTKLDLRHRRGTTSLVNLVYHSP